ncbi:hypothetical protein Gotri_025722 [Gossypium trilobum]|uniref:Uncharacterized protein n=1 Tax=Gossypium trilobum TaxID=34281 RepID=A0A7J9FQM8_9ROSI|nr:hypothetical protein [Gossypium trilobum]
MSAAERVRVESSDVRSFYSHVSTVTSRRLIKFRIGICVKRMPNGEPRDCFRTRFCINAAILIGFPY